MLHALFSITHYLLWILSIIVIVQVIFSWLFAFNVLNSSSQGVRAVAHALDRLTAPFYRPIRRIMPDFGAIDFSPLVLLILIRIADMLLAGAETSLTYGTI